MHWRYFASWNIGYSLEGRDGCIVLYLYFSCVGSWKTSFFLQFLGFRSAKEAYSKVFKFFSPNYVDNWKCLGMLEDALRVPYKDEVCKTWNSLQRGWDKLEPEGCLKCWLILV